jgi:hypothetical protein
VWESYKVKWAFCKKQTVKNFTFELSKSSEMLIVYASLVLLALLGIGMLMQPLHNAMTDLHNADTENAPTQ